MRKWKKLCSALLALAMMAGLAACGTDGNKDPNIEYGRYVETDISPEGMKGYMQAMEVSDDGQTIEIITVDYGDEGTAWQEEYLRFKTTDGGKSWEQINMDWINQYITDLSAYRASYDEADWPDEYTYVGNMKLMPGGDMMLTVYSYVESTETNESHILRVDEAGNAQEFSFPVLQELEESGIEYYLQAFEFLTEDKIFLRVYRYGEVNEEGYQEDLEDLIGIYSATGELLVDLSDWEGYDYMYNSELLLLQGWDGQSTIVDIASGTRRTDIDVPEQEVLNAMNYSSEYSNATAQISSDLVFYSVGSKGVQKVSAEMEEPEILMEGLKYTFGSPLASVQQFNLIDGDIFIMSMYYEDGSARVLRYEWDDDAAASSDQTLTVYALYDSLTVRLALSQYQITHPEVNVEYTFAFERSISPYYEEEGGAAMTEEDALRALNTELLSGNGPDVLILDDMPLQSYIEKGMFEDLSGLVDTSIISEVMQPMYTGDKLYAVPTRFSIPMLFGEKGVIEQYNTLDSLVEAIVEGNDIPGSEEPDYENWAEDDWNNYYNAQYMPVPKEDRPFMYFQELEEMIELFYTGNGPAVYSDKEGLNEENLTQLLEAMKQVSDKYRLDEEQNMNFGYGYSMSMSGAVYMTSNSVNRFAEQKALAGADNFTYFQLLQDISYSAYSARYNYYVDNEEGEEGESGPREYDSYSQQENTGVAMPSLAGGVYTPSVIVGVVSNSKHTELAKDFVGTMLSTDVQNYDMGDGLPVNREAFDYQHAQYSERDYWMVREGIEMMQLDYDSLFANISTPYFANNYLMEIVKNHAASYCRGTESLDEAVQNIRSETELYFAEMQ